MQDKLWLSTCAAPAEWSLHAAAAAAAARHGAATAGTWPLLSNVQSIRCVCMVILYIWHGAATASTAPPTFLARSLAGSEAAVLCVSHPLSRHPHTNCLCRAAAGRRLCLPAEAAASALSLPPNPLARSPALSHARSAAAAAAAAGGFDGDGGAPTPAVRVGRLVGRGRLGRAFIWGLIQNVWCMGEEVGMDFHTHPHRRC